MRTNSCDRGCNRSNLSIPRQFWRDIPTTAARSSCILAARMMIVPAVTLPASSRRRVMVLALSTVNINPKVVVILAVVVALSQQLF